LATAFFVVFLSSCSSPDTPLSFDTSGLESGWNRIELPGGATCANGDPYAFEFKLADPERIAVFLQGGGACSSIETCDIENGTYMPGMIGNRPRDMDAGIFDADNPRNPIVDYSMLFISYCTGDVFLGDTDVTYENEDSVSLTIPHRGLTYTEAALDWLFDRATSPERVAVMGVSAGAIGSPLVAGLVADRYPDTPVIQFGDGAGGYMGPGISESIRLWQGGRLFENVDWIQSSLSDTTDFVTLYEVVSRTFPNVRLHQMNAESDSVQVQFMQLGGAETVDLPGMIGVNLGRIQAADADFRSYTMPGYVHTILGRNELYAERVGTTALVDWISNALNDVPVESIRSDTR
jgi:hypothetical protein